MKIAIWKTGHEIAHKIAQNLAIGLNANIFDTRSISDRECIEGYDAHIGYGILRGMDHVFREAERLGKIWFNVDRGYFDPGHYDGYYRISYKGTQARYDDQWPIIEHAWSMQPIRKYDKSKPILVCPPTDVVKDFFNTKEDLLSLITKKCPSGSEIIIRYKGDQSPIAWDDISAVVTFNSSVGWQALQRGIPCLSDTTHSVVGSYYNTKSIDELVEKFNTMPREPLFNFMRAHQFTLAQIEQGQACSLITRYSSAMMAEKPSAVTWPPTVSSAALQKHFQSNT